MTELEELLDKITKNLDRIELELNMSAEAIESIEINARLLKEELDYLAENP